MARITIKPKEHDGPEITGELDNPGESDYWDLRLADGVTINSFWQSQWELVREEFELPTKRSAVVQIDWYDTSAERFIRGADGHWYEETRSIRWDDSTLLAWHKSGNTLSLIFEGTD